MEKIQRGIQRYWEAEKPVPILVTRYNIASSSSIRFLLL
jgi:hypothetical protein